MDPGSHALERT